MCCQAPPARPGARSRCGRRSEVGVGVGVVNGWWVGGVPGYPCAPEPEVTSPFLLGDSRTHVLRKKVRALRDGDGPGPPPLLPCFSSPQSYTACPPWLVAPCSFEASSAALTFSITSSLSEVSPPSPASRCYRPGSSRLHSPTPGSPRRTFLSQDPQLNPICKVPVAT